MKKILTAFVATVITAAGTINSAHAQIATKNSSSGASSNTTLSDIDAGMELLSNTATASDVNVRALRDFQKSFKGITNASWHKTSDGGFIASFTNNSIKTIVAYNARGILHHSIRYYNEKQLPHDIRARVKSIYYDYTILCVAEVHFEDQIIYMLTMQDETTIKWLRVTDEEMDVVKDYKRQ